MIILNFSYVFSLSDCAHPMIKLKSHMYKRTGNNNIMSLLIYQFTDIVYLFLNFLPPGNEKIYCLTQKNNPRDKSLIFFVILKLSNLVSMVLSKKSYVLLIFNFSSAYCYEELGVIF